MYQKNSKSGENYVMDCEEGAQITVIKHVEPFKVCQKDNLVDLKCGKIRKVELS